MTGENCWATAPLSPPCWIACCITDTFSNAARAVGAPKLGMRECAMTKANAKRMPGKEPPAASRLVIQRPPTTKPHQKNLCRNKKPSAGQPIRQTVERLDDRFLRSQPRVFGPGSLRKARPRQSDSQLNTQPDALNITT